MNKRILFATPYSSSFTIPIRDALQKLGYEVYLFDYLKPDFVSRVLGFGKNILKQSHFISPAYKKWVNERLLMYAQKIKPRFLFVIKGETLTADTIDRIKAMGTTTINWFPDNVGSWNLLMQTATVYDYYVSVCQYVINKLNKQGRQTLYLPVADVADKKIQKTSKEYNLVFAGHKTHKREAFFSTILDLGFHLWGYSHWKESKLAHYYHGLLKVDEMKEVFRHAKIVVNVSTAEEGVPISIANLKNFEATGVGAFVLSEYSPALAELFIEDKEMVFFRSKEELREKAKYYLKHDAKREYIAEAGWRRTKKDHTYRQRLTTLFKYITSRNKIDPKAIH